MTEKYKESLLPPLWVLALGVFALICYLLSELREIATLVVVAFSASYVIEPVLKKLVEKKISRPIGFLIVCTVAIIVITILVFTVLPVLQREFFHLIDNLPSYLNRAKEKILPLYERLQSYTGGAIEQKLDAEALTAYIQSYTPKILSGVRGTLLQGYSITLTIINLALLPFMIFYTSMNFPEYRTVFESYFTDDKRSKVSEVLSEIDGFVSKFVRGQLIVSSVLFVLYAIGLGLVGVELWFLLAVIAGFGNLIPYLGTILGVSLATLMSLITFGDFSHVLMVWAVFGVVQFIEGIIVTPKILGDNVGLSPLAIIISIFVAGSLFGFLGIFLAVPGAAIVKVLVKHFHAWILSKV